MPDITYVLGTEDFKWSHSVFSIVATDTIKGLCGGLTYSVDMGGLVNSCFYDTGSKMIDLFETRD